MDTIIPQKHCYKCDAHKPHTAFSKNRTTFDGFNAECKACKKIYDAKWQKTRINDTTKGMRTVGFSRNDYRKELERQNSKCAICGKEETSRNQWGIKSLAVDHDHATGKYRGLLCQSCNVKLGVLEDKEFVNAALSYLGLQTN